MSLKVSNLMIADLKAMKFIRDFPKIANELVDKLNIMPVIKNDIKLYNILKEDLISDKIYKGELSI